MPPNLYSFSKNHRIKKRSEFQYLLSQKDPLFGKYLILHYRVGKASIPKLGICLSRKFGIAVKRNRFKRQIRELFRIEGPKIKKDIELLVRPRKKAIDASFTELKTELRFLLQTENLSS